MKILILGTAYPYRGGLAAFNERLAQQFVSEGHDVKIETFTLQYPSFLFPGKTQYSDAPAPANLSIHRSVNSVNPFNWLAVGKKLRKQNYDLAIIKYWLPFMAPCLGTIAREIKKNGHTKIVSVLDNIIPHEKRIGDKMFSNYFVGAVDGFVYMSHSVGRDLDIFDKNKKRIYAPHPIYDNFGDKLTRDEALGHLNLSADKRYMLFFGFIRDYKGLDLLLRAMAEASVKDNDALQLIVAGEFYGNEEKYKQLEKELGLQGKIIWSNNFIDDAEVKYYFSAADIVVQPYKSATQSGVTQIAYHFEKPMIVTNVGGLSEFIPDKKVGYVVEPSVSAISAAILDFYADENYDRFKAGLVEEKQKYSWKNMVKAIQDAAL